MSTLPEEKKLYPSEEARLVARILKFPLQDHPIIPSPTEEQRLKMIERVGVQETMRMFLHREQRIRAEQDDPYRYGTELPAWPDADHILNRHNEILILGGNRASKTEYAAKRIAQAFVGQDVNGNMPDWLKEKAKKRGLNIWCLHTTHMTSVSMQQNVFHKYLPKELKEAKRSHQIQVAWTQKNGFSDNTAVYNKNQIWFLNYSQDIKVVEGGEVDFVWCDELVPADWLETLRYRLVTRNGKLIVTFTPILGYTQVVKEFISTSKINTWKESELLPNNNVLGVPKGHMPYTAESVYGKHGCIWFHSKLNPYNNWERMKQTLKTRSSHDIKIRAYGWAEQTAGSQFPMFGEVNIFDERVTDMVSDGTNYMVVDPAGARNWFMLWARVDEYGTIWVYREFPDASYGEWALPSDKADGKAGPAQRQGAGRGVNEYTELIWSFETAGDKREEIAERYIDPRSAGTETTSKEGGVTLLDLLAEATDPLHFLPSVSVTVDERVLILNDLLCYDREKPLDIETNHPRLMVHAECQNLIYSLREWTGADGQKGASKDPIDALGYLAVMQPKHTNSDRWKKQWQSMAKCGSY
jgi:phage terminase large subunit-like protein